MMKRSLFVAVLLVLLAVTLLTVTGCGSSSSSSGGSSSGGTSSGSTSSGSGGAVTIKGFAFDPATIDVKVGETVTWTNEDSATHNVKGDGGISSGDLAQGASYSKTFDTAGNYAYQCAIHPTMTGTVVVK
jgi:plastocyanin